MREAFSLDEVAVTGEMPTVCEWFAGCTDTPTHIVEHRLIGWVPTCERCKELATK
jgi:hypothetical protein